MNQVSRPVLFLLIAVVAFAAMKMTVLRPDAPAAAPAAATAAPAPASGITGAPQAAQEAVAGANAATEQRESAVTENDGAPAQAADDAAATAAAKTPRPQPEAPGDTTVLLFAGAGADDRVAREVVRSVQRRGVRTIVARLAEVPKYENLVGSVDIVTSPTILVVGPDRTARRIEGLPDLAQVEQALDATRR